MVKKEESKGLSSLDALRLRLDSPNLSPEERQRIYSEIGEQHEARGQYWRARKYFGKADDQEAIARSYEAQGKHRKAARIWYQMGMDGYGTENEESGRNIPLNQQLKFLQNAVRLYEQAGKGEIIDPLYLPPGGPDNIRAALQAVKSKIEWDKLTPEEREKRKKKQLEDMAGYRSSGSGGFTGLEMTTGIWGAYLTIPIIVLIIALFFLSNNITGNAIFNLTKLTSNIIGASLFLIGLIGVFFYFRNKK